MANKKKITVDQLNEMARRSDDRFIDNEELSEALNELKGNANNGYVYVADSQPEELTSGDLWLRTSNLREV